MSASYATWRSATPRFVPTQSKMSAAICGVITTASSGPRIPVLILGLPAGEIPEVWDLACENLFYARTKARYELSSTRPRWVMTKSSSRGSPARDCSDPEGLWGLPIVVSPRVRRAARGNSTPPSEPSMMRSGWSCRACDQRRRYGHECGHACKMPWVTSLRLMWTAPRHGRSGAATFPLISHTCAACGQLMWIWLTTPSAAWRARLHARWHPQGAG